MKKIILLTVFSLFALHGLPKGERVVAGQAQFQKKGDDLYEITASDKAILLYKKFDIARGEQVKFIQPSSKSTVLNRVEDADPSQILGRMESNGRLFLINPNGVFFGKEAVVDTAAFLASTLDIADEDFLRDRFAFVLEKGSGAIVNQGTIKGESFVALFASTVQNHGSILAKAGKVVLASAERVTLDFTGDGLMQFTVEGELKEALIESFGSITAAKGSVELSMATARDAIKMVVNSDGAVAATSIENVGGVFRLVDKKISLEGCKVEGKAVHISSHDVSLKNSQILVSSDLGGGEVLIEGDHLLVDRNSQIHAEARKRGDGGSVRLLSSGALSFDGKIFAFGGLDGGNGGVVETSAIDGVQSDFGFVDTSAASGIVGDWLIDPNRITIKEDGKASLSEVSPPNCSSKKKYKIAASTITSANSNVTLCATKSSSSRIDIKTDLEMENPGVSLTFTAGSTGEGRIRLRGLIATKGGDLTFNGQVELSRDSVLDTTDGGSYASGADILFSDIIYGERHLTLDAGSSGQITFSKEVGCSSELRSLIATAGTITQMSTVYTSEDISFSAGQINLQGNQTTQGGEILWNGPIVLGENITVDVTNSDESSCGADVTLTGTVDGAKSLTIKAGNNGTIALQGAVGAGVRPTALSLTGSSIVQNSTVETTGSILYRGVATLYDDLTTSGGYINFYNPVVLAADVSLDTTGGGVSANGANIYAYSTLDGNHNLTFQAGNRGYINLLGAVGGGSPLQAITVNSCNYFVTRSVNAESILQTSGNGFTYFIGALNISGSAGLDFTCRHIAFAAPVVTTAGGGFTANLLGSLYLLPAAAFTIDGPVVQSGANSFVQSWGKIFTDGDPISLAGTLILRGNSVMGTGNGAGDITFAKPVYGAFGLTLTAGTGDVFFSGSVGSPTRLGALKVSSCQDFTAQAIAATAIDLTCANHTQFNGNLNTNGALGILVAGETVSHTGSIITANAGPCTITNNGLYSEVFSVASSIDGTFTQNGLGPVNLQGKLSSVAGNIVLDSPLTLTGATAFSTALGNGNITLSDRIDGAVDFIVGSGSGSITIVGDIGAVSALNSFTIDTGGAVSVQAISAGTITQLDGVGTTSFNGALTTSSAGGILLAGSGFNLLGGAVTDLLAINNTGLFAQGVNSPITVVNSFTQSGTGSCSLANTISAGGMITFAGPVLLASDAQLSTAATGAKITLAGTLDGPAGLTLNSGIGDIEMCSLIGATTSVGDFVIANANNVLMGSIVADTITQSAGSGTSTFKGGMQSEGVSLIGNAFVLNGAVTTTNGGSFVLNNSGVFSAISGSTFDLDGPFSQTGVGSFLLNGSVTTTNDAILVTSPLTLRGNSSFSGGDVTLGQVDGAYALTLGGNDLILSAVGSQVPLTTLLIGGARDVSAQAITVGSFVQTAGSGLTTLNGAVSSSNAQGVMLTSDNISLLALITTAAGGPLTLDASNSLIIGSNLTVDGEFSAGGAAAISLGASIITNHQALFLSGPVTLTSTSQLSSGTGAGNITVANTVDGAFDLTLIAGEGDLVIGGAIGGAVGALSSLTATGANISVDNIGGAGEGIIGTTVLTADTSLTLTGTNYRLNPFTITAPTLHVSSGALTNIFTSGDAVSFAADVVQIASNTDLNVATSGGAITLPLLRSGSNDLRSVTLDAGVAQIELASVGSVGGEEFSLLSLTGGDLKFRGNVEVASMSLSPSGTIYLGGNLTTTSGSQLFPTAVIRDTSINNILISAGDITFQSSIDADSVGLRNLTLLAPAGDITISGAIGATTPLLAFLVPIVQDMTISSSINAVNIVQIAGTGISTFQGALQSSGVVGIDLAGTNFTFQDAITTSNGGNFVVKNTGLLTMEMGAIVNTSGKFTQKLGGTLSLSNAITAGNTVAIEGAVTLAGATSIDTSASNHSITFSGTLDGGESLTLAAGTNTIIFDGVVGGTARLGALTISSASHIHFNQACYLASLDAIWTGGVFSTLTWLDTNAPAGISLVGTDVVAFGGVRALGGGSILVNTTGHTTGGLDQGLIASYDFTQQATGTGLMGGYFALGGNFSFNHDILLAADFVIDTSGGNGSINLGSTVDGDFAFTCIAGSGDITFTGAAGSSIPLKSFQVISCGDLTAESTFRAKSVAQVSGSGTTHFQNDVIILELLSLTANHVTFDTTLTTTNGAATFITNSGLLTIQDAFSLDGAFTQSGSGTVSIGGSVVTTGDAISFGSPLTMTGDLTLNSGTGSGDLTLSSTVAGAFDLLLDAKGGNLTIGGAVGSVALPVGDFTIVNATNVTTDDIFANTILLSNASGATAFGKLQSGALGGISLTGNSFTFTDTITTAASGPFLLINSGPSAFEAAAIGSINNTFTITGSGAITLLSSITSSGEIVINPVVNCSGSAALNSSNQKITFEGAIEGDGDLILTAGSGDILFLSDVGGTTRLGDLTIVSCANFTLESITASTITQLAGSGTTDFQGNLDTSGAGGIQLTGTNFTCYGDHVTTNSGAFVVDNSGTWLTIPGFTAAIDGNFTQVGAGPIQLVGSMSSTNGVIDFISPLTLVGDLTLGANGVTLQNNVDGFYDFSLSAGSGNIILGGALGGSTRLEKIAITSANDVDVKDITAASISLTNATGTFSLVGDLNTFAPEGVLLTGNNFVRNGNVLTTGGGPVVINNIGTVTGTLGNTTSIDGGYFLNGPGAVNFVGGITTSNAPIIFAGDVTLIGDATFTTGNGPISFSTLDGTHNVTINCGEGDCTFQSAVGAITPLATLTINSAANLTLQNTFAASSILASSISQLALFQGAITTSGVITLSGNQFTFEENVTTTSGGALTVTLTGASPLTMVDGTAFNLDGPFSLSGGGSFMGGGLITTTNDAITLSVPVGLSSDLSLTSGGGNITCSGQINGAHTLTFSAGAGTISCNSDLGLATALSGLTVVDGGDLTLSTTTVAGALTTAVSGATTISGPLTAGTISLTTATLAANASLTTNSGAIALTNSSAAVLNQAINSNSTFTQGGGGALSLGANITTSGAQTVGSATLLLSPVTLTSGNGSISFSSSIGGVKDLTVVAGTGSVSFAGDLTVEDLLVQSAADVTIDTLTCVSCTQLAGSGTTTFGGAVATSGAGGFNLMGNQFVIDQAVSTTNGGPFILAHGGAITMAQTASLTLDGNFVEQGFGAISTGANITTTGDRIFWQNALTLLNDVTFDSGIGAGNIEFISTIGGAHTLTLLADMGNISLTGSASVGSLVANGAATILKNSLLTDTTVAITGQLQLGGDITTTNSNVTVTGNLLRIGNASSLIATGSGDIQITGDISSSDVGKDLTCTSTGNVTMSGSVGSGIPLRNLTCSGSAITINDVNSLSGTLNLTSTGAITFTGTTYNGASHLYTAATQFLYNAGALTTISANAQPITFTTGTIQLSTLTDLTLNGNGGNIFFADLLGNGHDLIADAGVGTVVVGDLGTPVNQLNDVTLAGSSVVHGTIEADGVITITTTSPVVISSNITTGGADLVYNSPVVLVADNLFFSTSDGAGGGGSITFNKTVDSDAAANPRNVTLQTFGNPLTFASPVGGSESVTSITCDGQSNLLCQAPVTCGAFTQTSGGGTTTFQGVLATSGMGGISLQANTIDIQGAITTQNSGPIFFDVATALLLNNTIIAADGPLTQTGAAAVSLGGSINTTADAINFASAITLTDDLLVTTTGGDITYSNTINGAYHLTLSSGTGNINFAQAIGGVTPVKSIVIASAGNADFAAVNATSLTQAAGSGTTTFNGTLATDTITGIILTGNNFTFHDAVTTTNNGPIVIVNAGELVAETGASFTAAKAFVQRGPGVNTLAGSFSAGGPMQFATAITLQGNLQLDTAINATNITLGGSVDGPHDLTFIAGGGSITMPTVGGVTPLATLTIQSAKNVTGQDVIAGALSQVAGTGLTSFQNINTNTVVGLSLVGTNFSTNGNLITTNGGGATITQSGNALLALGSSTSIANTFVQSGGGTTAISGDLITAGGAVTFTDPLTLMGNSTINSGNLIFNSTVDGTYDLTITSADLLFSGQVGGVEQVKVLQVNSAADVTYPLLNVESLSQQASSGITTIGGVITTSGSSGITLIGTTVNQNANLTTFNQGPVTITHSGNYTCTATTSSDGAFLETGGGNVIFNGSIATFSNDIQFDGNITLTGAMTLSTGGGSQGNISINGTLDGLFGVTLEAGTGDISIFGNVGSSTPIDTLTLSSARDSTLSAITATSLVQNQGSGTTTFSGNIATSGVSGIALVGNHFLIQNGMTTTFAGPLTVTQSGNLTLATGSNLQIDGDITTAGQGTIVISGSASAGGDISLHTEVSILGTAVLDTSANNTNITLLNTLEGSGDITLTLGMGNLNINGNVGGVTPLGSITIVSAGDVDLHRITAESIEQSSGTGITNIHGSINATGSGGILITTPSLFFNDSLTSAGLITLTTSSDLTLPIAQTITAAAAFTQAGGGSVTLGSNIVTTDANISFADPITLTSNIQLNSGSGGGDILLLSAIDGAQNLTLRAGTGSIAMNSALGATTPLHTLTITSAYDITMQALTCGAISQLAGSGTTTISGELNTDTPAGIQFVGTNFDHTGALVTTNAGSFIGTFTGTVASNAANTTLVDNAYILTAPAINLQGTFTTLQGTIEMHGAITLIEALTLNSSTGVGGILIDGTVDGAYAATLLAGSGDVILNSSVGATAALASLSITGGDISLEGLGGASAGVSGVTTVTAANDITFTGMTYNANAQTYTTSFDFVPNSGTLSTINSSGSALTFANGIIRLAADTDLTLQTGGGNLSAGMIRAAASSSRTFNADTGAGNLQITGIGSVGGDEFAAVTLTGNDLTYTAPLNSDALTITPSGTLYAGGDLTTTNTPISITAPIILTATNTFTTAGGAITFGSTIDGDSASAHSLYLATGNGDITAQGAIGATFRPFLLRITSANDATFNAAVTTDFLWQTGGDGTTTFNAPVTIMGVNGASLTGNNIAINQLFDTTSTIASLRVYNSGSFTFAGTATLSGSFYQLGSGTTTLSGSITADQLVSFAGPVFLTGTPTISTAATDQNIIFASPVDGGGDLTMSAGTGNITFSDAIGTTTRVGNFVVTSANDLNLEAITAMSIQTTTTGTATLNGVVDTDGAAGITLAGLDIIQNSNLQTSGGGALTITNAGNFVQKPFTISTLSGPFVQNSTGPVLFSGTLQTQNQDITIASPIITLYEASMDTGSGAGDILFSNTLDGAWDFTVGVGTGNITIGGPAGLFAPLKNLTITSAGNVVTNSIIASSITQSAGSGTTTFNGALTTTGAGGISLSGTNFVRNADWTATGVGAIRIDHSGNFTSTAAGNIFSGATFAQVGSGSVTLSNTIKTQNADLSFAGQVLLSGATTLTTGNSGGDISLTNTIDGDQNFTLNSGAGNLTATGAIGATTRLATFTIESAANATLAAITAATIQQIDVTETATYGGLLDANSVNGISLTGNAIILTGGANSTEIMLENRGLLTIAGPLNLSSTFSQVGAGAAALSSAISANGAVLFVSPLTLTGNSSITSTSNPITLSKRVEGPGSLLLDAGTSTINLQGSVGATQPLNDLTISSAGSVNVLEIHATTIGLVADTITINGIFEGTTSNSCAADTITITGELLGGTCSLQHTNLLTLNLGSSTSLTGDFTESGSGGSVLLSGTLQTASTAIQFTNPIILLADTQLHSSGSGDLTIQNTIDGDFALTLNSGTGNLQLQGDCNTNSFHISGANDVTTQGITAGIITQASGSGTTTFNGAINGMFPEGINLTGSGFVLNSPLTTLNSGPLNITNSSILTLTAAANLTLSGEFSQQGAGETLLDGTLTTEGANITFTGPITLTGNATLQSGIDFGDIILNGAINGAQNLSLQAGSGSIAVAQTIGGITPIGTLTIIDAQNLTSGAVYADTLLLTNVNETTNFGSLTTTQDISLSGNVFNLNGDIQTVSGALTIDNFGALTTTPNIAMNLGGNLTITNTGTLNLCGTIETNSNAISIANPITLNQNLAISSSNGNILLQGEIEGTDAITVSAGTGDITVTTNIATNTSLKSFSITDANDVTLNGVGTSDHVMEGLFSINAAGTVTLDNVYYGAKTQVYSSDIGVNFVSGSETTLYTNGGAITFGGAEAKQKSRLQAPPTTPLFLADGTDLTIITNNGPFTFNAIDAAGFENIIIDTGTNIATLRLIGAGANINSLTVIAGEILLEDQISVVNLSLTANGLISNSAGQVLITTESDAFFNSQTLDVGTIENPILVNSSQKIIAGGVDLAAFDGSAIDNTVHAYEENPPCVIYFNGVKIKDCNWSYTTSENWLNLGPIRGFNVPGMESSQFNLASDYFFKFYFMSSSYMQRENYMFSRY